MNTAESAIRRERRAVGIFALIFCITTCVWIFAVFLNIVSGAPETVMLVLGVLVSGVVYFGSSYVTYCDALSTIKKEREGKL